MRRQLPLLLAPLITACALDARAHTDFHAPPVGYQEVEPDSDSSGDARNDASDDLSIALVIERELAHDPIVPSNRLDVSVEAGVATVAGTVRELLSGERAIRIARSVRGVSSVIDRIQVEPFAVRSDAAIERDVEDALLRNPATESYDLQVSVVDGVATLSGSADSWRENELAQFVAKNVRGVVGVVDDVRVEFTEERSDQEIASEVREMLVWNVLVDAADVQVEVEDAVVTVSGEVASAAEHWEVRRAAWTSGVDDVDTSGLQVVDDARRVPLRDPDLVMRADHEIRAAVERALSLDPRVDPSGISLVVRDGDVSLYGRVSELAAERAAEGVAANTLGVDDVESFIKVRPDEDLADDEIEDRIRAAFVRDATVERYELGVDVFDGTATLFGTVDSAFERRRAADLAAETTGVEEIVDLIDVERPGRPLTDLWLEPWPAYPTVIYDYDPPIVSAASDAEIEADIAEELFWSPFVHSDRVQVDVVDGVATLTGTVADHGERSAAIENAYEGGAVLVNDQLEVL